MLKRNAKKIVFSLLFLTMCFRGASVSAQVRSGAAFLKMLPGARVQSMAGAATAVLDDPNSVFANPAAAAFFRDWVWSAGYTKWIADISNASFIYGRQIPMPWSRETRFGIGLIYQGTSAFTNDDVALPEASASDLSVSLSYGQPLTFLSNNLSLGGNFKYVKSLLAQYSAGGFVYDFGFMAKTSPIALGKKFQGVFSFGAAMTQNGGDLTFVQVGTPLPQTMRAGLAFYRGAEKGTRMLLSADYVSVRDEKPYISIGGEFAIGRYLAVNAGYDFGSDLFKKMTFGLGVRLDDAATAVGEAFPGKHNAFRLDFATLDESEFFSRTYRGTATHYSSQPEPFRLATPANGDSVYQSNVVLRWKAARELGVFDNIVYHVLVDRDSSSLAHIISAYDENPELFWALLKSPLVLNKETRETSVPLGLSSGGDYYWTVAAIDADQQVRFGATESGAIARFGVRRSDIELKDIRFEYSPYITMDDYQGIIKIVLQNNGDLTMRNVHLRVRDDVERLDFNIEALVFAGREAPLPENRVHDFTVAEIKPGEQKQVEMEWRTMLLGRHKIYAEIDPNVELSELNRANNRFEKSFYTIPKGNFSARDEAPVIKTSSILFETPLITQITFDRQSAEVREEYIKQESRLPVLSIVARRLRENPTLSIRLEGFADPNSNEHNVELADRRANAVKKKLVELGARSEQIQVLPGRVLSDRLLPHDAADAEMLREERRYVEISASIENRRILLRPIQYRDVRIDNSEVYFSSDVASAISLQEGALVCAAGSVRTKQKIALANPKMASNFSWRLSADAAKKWLDKEIEYSLSIRDSLGRSFQSAPKLMQLQEEAVQERRIVAVPYRFGETEPPTDFYWQRLLHYAEKIMQDSSMHVRIEGYACAIGAESVNLKLSQERARRFDRALRQYIKSNKKEFADDILDRFAAPVGFGESKPLTIEQNDSDVQLGDNSTSLGRKLNRRVQVVFFKDNEKQAAF